MVALSVLKAATTSRATGAIGSTGSTWSTGLSGLILLVWSVSESLSIVLFGLIEVMGLTSSA